MTAPTTQTLLEQATEHLTAAAHLARRDDDTSRAHAVAGVIQLTRAGIAPATLEFVDPPPGPTTTIGRLRAALAALDAIDPIDPIDGSPDLLAWSWQVADLIRILECNETAQP